MRLSMSLEDPTDVPIYGDVCTVSVNPSPFYAHIWRSLMSSYMAPFVPIYRMLLTNVFVPDVTTIH